MIQLCQIMSYLVSNVAEDELVWEVSELFPEIAGLVRPVVCQEDPDHGV